MHIITIVTEPLESKQPYCSSRDFTWVSAVYVTPEPNVSPYPLDAHHQLGIPTGAVFAVPIPQEYESVGLELQEAVEQALQQAEQQGVSKWGKAATPWLLKRVGELTAGKSLESSTYSLNPYLP